MVYSKGEITKDVLFGLGAITLRTGEAFSADRMTLGSRTFLGRTGDTEHARAIRGGVEGGLGVFIRRGLFDGFVTTTARRTELSLTTLMLDLARNCFKFAGGPLLIIYYNIIVP